MIEALLSFSIATLGLAISPGPDNIYVLTQSLANGTKSGIATTAGLVSGCIVHTSLLAFGVSALLAASQTVFYAIKIFGACYLLYLAYKVYTADSQISVPNSTQRKTYLGLYKTGILMNLVNPKVLIFFLAFFPGFLWDKEGNTVLQFYILGSVFMLLSFITFSAIAMAAGRISNLLLEWKGMSGFLKWLQIFVFMGIALFILLPQ